MGTLYLCRDDYKMKGLAMDCICLVSCLDHGVRSRLYRDRDSVSHQGIGSQCKSIRMRLDVSMAYHRSDRWIRVGWQRIFDFGRMLKGCVLDLRGKFREVRLLLVEFSSIINSYVLSGEVIGAMYG
ncbi:hypothetical protein Tco_0140323 [Tanacetum coccineum]